MRINLEGVGRRIAEARAAIAGLTQRRLAERVGVTERTVQAWEAGERAPSRYLTELETVLDIPRTWLLWGDDEPPTSELAHLERRLERAEEAVGALSRSLGIALRALQEQGLEVTEAAEQVPSITYPVDGEALDVVTGERRKPD